TLADHLVSLGHLNDAQRAVVEALADLLVAKHGDLEQSLAALPAGRSTRESLAQLGDEPVMAWREPLSRRVRRWAQRHRTAVTAAAGALVAGIIGWAAVLAVPTRAKAELAQSLARETRANVALAAANEELIRSRAGVQARYDLAVEAIKTFHTGVSEDSL